MLLDNALAQKLFMIYVTNGIADPKTALDIVTDMSDDDLIKNIRLYENQKAVEKNMGGIVSINQLTQPMGIM